MSGRNLLRYLSSYVCNGFSFYHMDSDMPVKGKLLKFADKRAKWLLVASVMGNLASGAAFPVFLYLFGQLANAMTGAAAAYHWTTYIVFMAITAAADFGFAGVGSGCAELAAERQQRALRLQFLDEIMRQEIGYFDQFDATTLGTQLSYNCNIIRTVTGQRFGLLFLYIGFTIAALIFSFTQSVSMTLISLIPVPFILGSGIWANRVDARAATIVKQSFEEAAAIAHESFLTIKTVKLFSLDSMLQSRFNGAVSSAMTAGSEAGFLAGFGLGLHWGLMFVSFGLGFWWGVKKVADSLESDPINCLPIFEANEEFETDSSKCFTAGIVISVFWCIVGASFFLSKATPTISNVKQANFAIGEIVSLYSRQSRIDPYLDSGIQEGIHKGEVCFKDVAFSYPTRIEKNVFKRLNLLIPAGYTVALVGASGCGKSTIIQLLERFYDPDNGIVEVDGKPVAEYNLKFLRSKIALVSQEPRLFADTIAANIGCGKEGATRGEIEEAAKQANAHGFITQFPNGYDTWVGEGGGQLSGGQKQRIAIARALIRNPLILILDEATSALDNQSEKVVQAALTKIVQEGKRTTIIIAHRLSTIRDADKIIVLDNPNGDGAFVAEEGTHDELLANENGLYSALVSSQLKNVEEGPQFAAQVTEILAAELAVDFSRELSSRQNSIVRLQSKFSVLRNSYARHVSGSVKSVSSELVVPEAGYYRRTVRPLRSVWWIPLSGIIAAIFAGYWIPADMRRAVSAFASPCLLAIHSVQWAFGFVGLGVLAWLSMWMQRWFLDRSSEHLLQSLRKRLFTAAMSQNMTFFDHPRNNPGVLLGVLSTDVLQLRAWGGEAVAIWTQSIITLIIAAALGLSSSWKLGLVSLSCVLLMAPVSYYNSRLMRHGSIQAIHGSEKEGFV
eukprot:Gregarina_sp_Poly_1__10427@NODE_751_length_6464_cov_674_361576_g363_i2_p1_GENE_NODE_751_length_6464_cov_674_361576_g363_i2NODE_751_length_6464_cov_674_361576_g363_i2_p1_ORF_typecomplete_len900_score133_05ABC_membrane/PF00664_23/7e34ABC_membrane/PF00664_23/3_2e26ABC_tran/PF00005_27/5_7e03ABC_tran/PF00005_27/5_4e40SMC_N/PF02463_19/50SMC_N/PF02463_19/0_00015AAA_21/PF13304_6/0_00011AAA/PF00004_29/0_00011AAA_22/PF13401_6/0_00056AAA_16/PF13191_6/0_0054AAA_16/PF13191_6/1_8e03TniB/PF05621_11/0_046AAA_15